MTPVVEPFALCEIADGVLVWLQPGGGPGVSNAGVVVDDDGLTIVDTLMVRSQWGPFAEAVRGIERPVRRIVVTHAHIDHVGGTRAFPHAAVYASPVASAALDQPMPLEAYQAFMPDFADELAELGELGTRVATHEIDGAAQLTPRIEVLPAAGHTAGDLLALVAEADVCFAGGLGSFGVTPLAFQGDPGAWADVLDAVIELADTIVPGCGPLGGEAEARDLQAYLRACVTAAGDAAAIPSGPWDAWPGRALGDAVNVQRARLLAGGRDELPPAMLAAMGAA